MIARWFRLSLLVAFLFDSFSSKAASEDLVPALECRERGGLPTLFAKLRKGAEVRIAYLGGSITAQEGWRPKTLNWFRENFRTANVSQINAAVGGTGSDLGVFRLKHDVLDHKPDLVFVEFAVNDDGAPPQQICRCMEGIVRQIFKHDAETDVCFVYTLAENMLGTLQKGFFPQSASSMEKVADYYDIPSIHIGLEVACLQKAGKVVFKGDKPKTKAEIEVLGGKILFSPDGVHPYTDTGHQLYLEAMIRSLAKIQKVSKPGPHVIPNAYIADNWEAAKMLPLSGAKLSAGWRQLDPQTDRLAKAFGNRLPGIWGASKPGESISFKFSGTTARIYDLVGPDCGQVSIALDDTPPVIKPRFDAFCTYHRLGTLSIGEGLPQAVHTVKITILPDQPDKANILSQRNEKMDDPKRFDGITWYAGGILLVGELVE
jgi:hypothetical protein